MNRTTIPTQLLMQYPITLPADYDMGTIRERVRTRGSALDDRGGLTCKVYGIREVGTSESRVNQYAPFYLWHDVTAAADFLWRGQGFDGIVRDFARPTVHTWLPCSRSLGAAPATSVVQAVVQTTSIDPDVDLRDEAQRLTDRVARRGAEPHVHLAAAGIDPAAWRSVEITTINATDPSLPGAVYTVLHISQPSR